VGENTGCSEEIVGVPSVLYCKEFCYNQLKLINEEKWSRIQGVLEEEYKGMVNVRMNSHNSIGRSS
jgi:hypothetical protein